VTLAEIAHRLGRKALEEVASTAHPDTILVRWIDRCIELRSTVLIWVYIGDTAWRKDPRFAEVQRKMGVHY